MNYIKIENIFKSYSAELYNGLSFEFKAGAPCAIKGKNGSGKSTLLNVTSLHYSPDAGSVKYFSGSNELSIKEIRNAVGIVSPYFNPYDEMSMKHLAEFVSAGNENKLNSINRNYKVFEIDQSQIYGEMSVGFKQRVKISLAFNSETEFLLLDEPFTALDSFSKKLLQNLIDKNKKAVVIIASNNDEEFSFCKKEIVLD